MIFKLHTLRKIILPLCLLATPFAFADNNETSVLNVNTQIDVSNLITPASFETDVHNMMYEWYMNRYVVKSTVPGRKAPTFNDQDYIDRLKKLPTVINMPYNAVVKSFIKLYVERKRDLVEKIVALSRYYEPLFIEVLDSEGMPLELRNLAIIESALNPTAKSSAGAAGLWQFMTATALDEGLEVNSLVDERCDPYRSTVAAARYLNKLYKYYGDWFLAIAAYNCGAGKVNQAIRKAGGEKDYWLIYNYLPSETRTYVPAFIAANYVMAYYEDHNICPSLDVRPVITATVEVNKRVHFQQISDVLGIPMEDLRALNPQYRADVIPGDIKTYTLTLPHMQSYCYQAYENDIIAHDYVQYARKDVIQPGQSSKFTEADKKKEDEKKNDNKKVEDKKTEDVKQVNDAQFASADNVIYHKIKPKDTVGSIAEKYGIPTEDVIRANGGSKGLKRGDTLTINIGDGAVGLASNLARLESNTVAQNVEQSQTQDNLSATTAETPADEVIAALNMSQQNKEKNDKKKTTTSSSSSTKTPAKNNAKTVNKTNTTPAKTTAKGTTGKSNTKPATTTAKANSKTTTKTTGKNTAKTTKKEEPAKTHTVASGDNLYDLAKKNNVTIDEIKKANNMKNNNLKPGQVINIPTKEDPKKAQAAKNTNKNNSTKKSTNKSTTKKATTKKTTKKGKK